MVGGLYNIMGEDEDGGERASGEDEDVGAL
jgi:hypothetical protein